MQTRRVSIPLDVYECIRKNFCHYRKEGVDDKVTDILLDYLRSEHWDRVCDTARMERVLTNHKIKPVGGKEDVIII